MRSDYLSQSKKDFYWNKEQLSGSSDGDLGLKNGVTCTSPFQFYFSLLNWKFKTEKILVVLDG